MIFILLKKYKFIYNDNFVIKIKSLILIINTIFLEKWVTNNFNLKTNKLIKCKILILRNVNININSYLIKKN